MAKRRRLVSAHECTQEWKALWEIADHNQVLDLESDKQGFDCSSLVAHEKQLVERQVRSSISKWQALEDRKVKQTSKKNGVIGWVFKTKLPLNFDYLSRLEEPPTDNGQGERVVSLLDPTNTTESYETELWKIFNDTETIQDLRQQCGLKRSLEADAQLRMSDRHDLPATTSGPMVTTVFLEFWKRSLRDGTSLESNRMVLEFLGEQTLLDVHLAIEELSEDGLWTGGKSGLILVEGTFYTAGDVDYVKPILEWLEADKSRYEYLGLPEKLQTKRMDSIRLNNIQWSLNTRYVHIHHGNVESSLFLTDILQSPKRTIPYPIIHDIWTPTYSAVHCEGCKQRAATLVTPSTCEETDGAAQICQSCHDNLFKGQQSNAMDIHVFKQQHDVIPPGEASDPF